MSVLTESHVPTNSQRFIIDTIVVLFVSLTPQAPIDLIIIIMTTVHEN